MGRGCPWSDVQMSVRKIHLPQTLNEEAIADEFSDWEQVSFRTAKRFVPRTAPPHRRVGSPVPFIPTYLLPIPSVVIK